MTDVSLPQSSAEDARTYEIIADQLLQDLRALNERMRQDRVEIDILKAETRVLKTESVQLESQSQEALSRLNILLVKL